LLLEIKALSWECYAVGKGWLVNLFTAMWQLKVVISENCLYYRE